MISRMTGVKNFKIFSQTSANHIVFQTVSQHFKCAHTSHVRNNIHVFINLIKTRPKNNVINYIIIQYINEEKKILGVSCGYTDW